MAKGINRLTDRQVKTIRKAGRHADGGGLYLSTTGGGRRWVFLYRWHGKLTELGFGSVNAVSLQRAREKAATAREALADGIDPRTVRKPTERRTFGEVADEYWESMKAGWRSAEHAQQFKQSLRDHAAKLRDMAVADIGTEDVLKVLRPIWTTKPETASRVRNRIERILDAAAVQELRSAENPARWRGHLKLLLAQRPKIDQPHHAAMPYADVPAFMAELRERDGIAPIAFRFLILTAARANEVLGATWDEIGGDVWTVPPERMKAGKPHRVPLSKAALDAIGVRPETGGFVFPGRKKGRHLTDVVFGKILNKMGLNVTTHGFRSSFRDWAADCTNTPDAVCEAALAHVTGSKTEAAYRRGDLFEKRRKLMEAWADYCTAKPGMNVIPLRTA